jgi:phosphohistidine phosphatase
MDLYLVRHAIAVDREVFAGPDEARTLTPKGIQKMRAIVRGLDVLQVQLDAIWTSPLVRAVETAELLAELRTFSGQLQTMDALSPGGDFDRLRVSLYEQRQLARVALVGHEPDLGELATRLMLGGTGRPGYSAVAFKKGGVALFEVDVTAQMISGVLRWQMTPKQMQRMT